MVQKDAVKRFLLIVVNKKIFQQLIFLLQWQIKSGNMYLRTQFNILNIEKYT